MKKFLKSLGMSNIVPYKEDKLLIKGNRRGVKEPGSGDILLHKTEEFSSKFDVIQIAQAADKLRDYIETHTKIPKSRVTEEPSSFKWYIAEDKSVYHGIVEHSGEPKIRILVGIANDKIFIQVIEITKRKDVRHEEIVYNK